MNESALVDSKLNLIDDLYYRLNCIIDAVMGQHEEMIGITFYSKLYHIDIGYNKLPVMKENTSKVFDYESFEENIDLYDITPKLFINKKWM